MNYSKSRSESQGNSRPKILKIEQKRFWLFFSMTLTNSTGPEMEKLLLYTKKYVQSAGGVLAGKIVAPKHAADGADNEMNDYTDRDETGWLQHGHAV